MSERPATTTPEASLRDALASMNNHGVRELPVVDGTTLVGIITDRDIRLAVQHPEPSHEHRDERAALLDELSVGATMTPDPVCVGPDDSIGEVAETLRLRKFGACPVVQDGRLIGIVTVSDFLRLAAERGVGSG